jgi:ribonuclease J
MPKKDEIKFYAVGGYSEYGRNMTAVEVDDEIVIFDMGIKLDRILIHEDAVFEQMHSLDLIGLGAIPDDQVLDSHRDRVVAIVTTHGHLDHIGAIPKLAHRYKAPVFATPFTASLIEHSLHWEKKHRAEIEVIPTPTGQIRPVGKKTLQVELVRMTHSIVDSSTAVLHTPYGEIVYANDFKLDNSPVIGKPPDYDRLRAIGAGAGESGRGVALYITETTRAHEHTKTESESVARAILKDHILGLENDEDGMIVTTFSSHTARIKSIVEYGKRIGREVVLLGGSMERYNQMAQKHGFADYMDEVMVYGRRNEVYKCLSQIMQDGKEHYLIVTTGHQGEEDALLPRMARDETPYKFEKGDHVIFSSNVIPNPMNIANTYVLEQYLKKHNVRMIRGAHVSGHGAREDHWEMLNMLQPESIVPGHGDLKAQANYIGIAADYGYSPEKQVHLVQNGRTMRIKV